MRWLAPAGTDGRGAIWGRAVSGAADRLRGLVPGLVVAVAGFGFMVWQSVVQWGTLPTRIVTRAAAAGHGATVVPKAVMVSVLPVLLLSLVVVFCVVVAVGGGAEGSARSFLTGGPRGPRAMSWALIGLAPLLSAMHVGLLREFAGRSVPMGNWMAAGAAWAVVCGALGSGAFLRRRGYDWRFAQAGSAGLRWAGRHSSGLYWAGLYWAGVAVLVCSGVLGLVIALTGPWLAAMAVTMVGMLAGCGLMLVRGVLELTADER
ncbi:MAG: hypothetical protein LBC97_06980 [Bifidobacteriaceae bacterium]|nr:hypothetical protein [Bifidobacteriaceae bacterium]